MTDKYYIDYRRGEIIKNLDTTFLAPEQYNEVEVNEELEGSFIYTYIDENNRLLSFSFTVESLQGRDFFEVLDEYCKNNDFIIADMIRKLMYVSQDMFDQGYRGR